MQELNGTRMTRMRQIKTDLIRENPFNPRHPCSILLFLILNYFTSFSQSYPNLGFENGNLNGWNAFTGQCCPVYISNTGINSLSHSIVTGTATDAYTNGVVPIVAPGNTFSAKLGNDSANSEAERLTYTFTVSAAAPLLIYQYAVVFQFPINHPPSKQPRFEAIVTDANSDTIECTLFSEVAANSIAGFNPVNEIRYKNWTDAAIDLTDYIGQTVTLQFSTGDCGMGGHFGYAYIDAYATEMKIKDTLCDADGAITLNAPPGFSSYQWSTGATTQQIKVNSIKAGDVISLNLLSTTGCEYALHYVIPDFVPACVVTANQLCNTKFHIEGVSSVVGSVIDSTVFIFDTQSTTQNSFDYDFVTEGNYQLTYIAYAANNCTGKFSLNIDASKTLFADFTNDKSICPLEATQFTNTSKSLADVIKYYTWNFENIISTQENPEYIFSNEGNHIVELFIESENGCKDFVSKTITVLSETDCNNFEGVYFPNSFSPNNDGKNDFYEIQSAHGEVISIEIFSRWGELVFKKSGNKISWSGLDKQNKKVQQGLYPATLSVPKQNETIRTSVNILLLR